MHARALLALTTGCGTEGLRSPTLGIGAAGKRAGGEGHWTPIRPHSPQIVGQKISAEHSLAGLPHSHTGVCVAPDACRTPHLIPRLFASSCLGCGGRVGVQGCSGYSIHLSGHKGQHPPLVRAHSSWTMVVLPRAASSMGGREVSEKAGGPGGSRGWANATSPSLKKYTCI